VRRVSGVAGLGIIASAQSFGMYVVALVVFGFGEGLYLSVDMALAAAVLPNPEESAKDMGVVNYPGLKSRACTTGTTGGGASFASSLTPGCPGWGGGR